MARRELDCIRATTLKRFRGSGFGRGAFVSVARTVLILRNGARVALHNPARVGLKCISDSGAERCMLRS